MIDKVFNAHEKMEAMSVQGFTGSLNRFIASLQQHYTSTNIIRF
jgi:hypothetical protein